MKNRLAIFSLLLLFPTARLGAQTAGAQTPAAAKPDVMSSFEFVVGAWQPVADPAHPAPAGSPRSLPALPPPPRQLWSSWSGQW